MTKRLVAVVVAVAMVVISIAVRNALDDDSSDSPSGSGSEGELAIICIPELADVCADLDATVTVEPAGTTAARIATGEDLRADGWLTYAAFAPDAEVLATSPLGLAMRSDRAAVLTEHCGEVTWRCVGDVAGQPWSNIGGDETWGVVRPAHPEPVTSALGRLIVGQAVASFLGTESFSRIDWEANDDFPGWFQRLEQAVPSDAFVTGTDPYEKWLRQRLVGYDVVATTQAQAAARDNVTVIYPAPVATAQVVLAPIAGGSDPSDLADDAEDALVAQGYDAATGDPVDDGLPAAGVLEALSSYWESVVR